MARSERLVAASEALQARGYSWQQAEEILSNPQWAEDVFIDLCTNRKETTPCNYSSSSV